MERLRWRAAPSLPWRGPLTRIAQAGGAEERRASNPFGAALSFLPQSERPESVLVVARGITAEATEHDVLQTAHRVQSRRHSANRDARCAIGRKAIDAG